MREVDIWYMLFGAAHDPGVGGCDTFIAAYRSLEEAKAIGQAIVQYSIDHDDPRYATSDVYRWMHIARFDGFTMNIVAELDINYWRGGPKQHRLTWRHGLQEKRRTQAENVVLGDGDESHERSASESE